jgi:hypothetical protein
MTIRAGLSGRRNIIAQALTQMRQTLLQLMAETREPYFDVLMEHGVKPEPALDVGLYPGRGKVSPHWADLVKAHPDIE